MDEILIDKLSSLIVTRSRNHKDTFRYENPDTSASEKQLLEKYKRIDQIQMTFEEL